MLGCGGKIFLSRVDREEYFFPSPLVDISISFLNHITLNWHVNSIRHIIIIIIIIIIM